MMRHVAIGSDARVVSLRAAVGLGFTALGVAASTAWCPAPERPAEAVALPPTAVERALESEPPDRPTMSDAIAHFEARLATRGNERFSRTRLVAAHLLRFRAYGGVSDLDAVDAHLDALEAGGHRDPALLSSRAALHLARHEFRSAREAVDEAGRVAELYDPALQLRRFDVLWASGAYEEAAAVLELPHDTASVDWLARRARVLDRLGYVGRARDHMRRVLRKVRAYAQPPAVRAWALVELGHFEHHAGDPPRAVDLFLEALEVLPGSPAALEGLGDVALGVDRDVDAAIRLYGRALEHGGHVDLLARLADLEENRGRPERARALRDELVRRAMADPQSLRWSLRPLAHALAGEPATVCRALTWARLDLVDRRDSGGWDALAWALYRKGELAAAYEASLAATSWGTPHPGIAYRAGVIASATGDRKRARSMLTLAREGATELTGAEVREAERRLAGEGRDDGPRWIRCS